MRSLPCVVAVLLGLAASSAQAAAPTITTFPAGAGANDIASSPGDGTLWITQSNLGVRQFSTNGELLGTDRSFPASGDVAVDPDRTVYWATGTGQPAGYAKRSPGGVTVAVRETQAEGALALLIPSPGAKPFFTGGFPTSTGGAVYQSAFVNYGPASSPLPGLAQDGDGRLWAVASVASQAFRVDPASADPDLSVSLPVGSFPTHATGGPEGSVWITGFGNSDTPSSNSSNRIVRVTPNGIQTSFVLPSGKGPNDITVGPDGALWFTEFQGLSIGRITTSGQYASFPLPTGSGKPLGITTGPDGNIWFTEQTAGGAIARLVPGVDPPATEPLPRVPQTGGRDTVPPRIASLALSRTRFRAARSGASISAKRRRAPVGARVGFGLSEPSTVRFTVERKVAGRRSGRRCVAPKRSNRKKKRCDRYVGVRGSFSVRGRAGANAFTFRGRVGGRALSRGSYRLVGRATDAARNASAPSRAGFTIVR